MLRLENNDEKIQKDIHDAIARHFSFNIGLNFNRSYMLMNHNLVSLIPRYRYYPNVINHNIEFNFFGRTPKIMYRYEKYSHEEKGFGFYGQASIGRDKYLPSEMYSVGAGVFFGLCKITKASHNLADIIERQRENLTMRCGFETDHSQLREVGCSLEKHFGAIKIAAKLSANNAGSQGFIPRLGFQVTHAIDY